MNSADALRALLDPAEALRALLDERRATGACRNPREFDCFDANIAAVLQDAPELARAADAGHILRHGGPRAFRAFIEVGGDVNRLVYAGMPRPVGPGTWWDDIHMCYSADQTVLQAVIQQSRVWCDADVVDIAGMLLERGADVHTKDRGGRTPLLMALGGPAPTRTVRLLIAHGADITVVDRQDICAVSLAVSHDHTEALEVLLRAGASPFVPWRAQRPTRWPIKSLLFRYCETYRVLAVC